MKVKVLVLTILVITLTGLLYYRGYIKPSPTTVFRDGVKIGNVDLSGKTWDNGMSTLNKIFQKPLYLNADSTSRAVTLPEVGIDLDRDRLERYTKVCKYHSPNLLCRKTSNEPVVPQEIIKIDAAKLNNYLDSLENDFQYAAANTIISFEDYSFRVPGDSAKLELDRTEFVSKEVISNLITKGDMKLKLRFEPQDEVTSQHAKTEALIENISTPLLIKYGGSPIYIPTETISSFIKTEERNLYLYGIFDPKEISAYLESLRDKYETVDVKLIHDDAVIAIQRALLYRAASQQVNTAVILPIEGKPKTNGELHDAYLEIIKSQQRLYKFEHGELTDIYVISTGITWDTPSGEFSILGKQKMTISYFGNWYMPDYLPIGAIYGQYRFGFHAIPYHMDGAGNIYSRDPNTMGSPATGGCIQLKPKEALELYNWAKIGTPVYIYE